MEYINNVIGGAVLAAALGFAGAASAATVIVSDQQTQTVGGQDFNFSFTGLAMSDGNGGTLVLSAAGDYDHGGFGPGTEFLSFDAEGIFGATGVGDCAGTSCQGGPFDFVVLNQPLGNVAFQRTYNLTGLQLDALLADGQIDIFVDLDSSVGLFNAPNFVGWTVTYETAMTAIPLPAGLPLLIGGLAALGLVRRRASA